MDSFNNPEVIFKDRRVLNNELTEMDLGVSNTYERPYKQASGLSNTNDNGTALYNELMKAKLDALTMSIYRGMYNAPSFIGEPMSIKQEAPELGAMNAFIGETMPIKQEAGEIPYVQAAGMPTTKMVKVKQEPGSVVDNTSQVNSQDFWIPCLRCNMSFLKSSIRHTSESPDIGGITTKSRHAAMNFDIHSTEDTHDDMCLSCTRLETEALKKFQQKCKESGIAVIEPRYIGGKEKLQCDVCKWLSDDEDSLFNHYSCFHVKCFTQQVWGVVIRKKIRKKK